MCFVLARFPGELSSRSCRHVPGAAPLNLTSLTALVSSAVKGSARAVFTLARLGRRSPLGAAQAAIA
jgi:hypothetical protein